MPDATEDQRAVAPLRSSVSPATDVTFINSGPTRAPASGCGPGDHHSSRSCVPPAGAIGSPRAARFDGSRSVASSPGALGFAVDYHGVGNDGQRPDLDRSERPEEPRDPSGRRHWCWDVASCDGGPRRDHTRACRHQPGAQRELPSSGAQLNARSQRSDHLAPSCCSDDGTTALDQGDTSASRHRSICGTHWYWPRAMWSGPRGRIIVEHRHASHRSLVVSRFRFS